MKDIKELALKIAEEVYGAPVAEHAADEFCDFAHRLIAAYCAEMEPVGEVIGFFDENKMPRVSWFNAYPDKGTKLFAAPPEPAPNQEPLHVGDSQFESWFSTYWNASLRNGSKQIARDAYAAGMGDPLVVPAACAAGIVPSNVELTGAAQLHRAASRERSERGRP